MRIVMTLVLRDEEDILAANLDYHLSRGIDHVIATDHRSRDTTPDILERYRAKGLVTWFREEGARFHRGRWFTRMAELASSDHDADWIINNDADEFWWPRCGDLKTAFAGVPDEVDVIGVPRFNYLPSEAPGPFWESMTVRDERPVNPIGRPLPSKRCHRGRLELTGIVGMHQLVSSGLRDAARTVPVEILHFPDRSLEQFRRAVAKHNDSREGRLVAFSPRLHLARLYRGGALEGHWERMLASARAVRDGRWSERYRTDTRFRDYMRTLRAAGATPA